MIGDKNNKKMIKIFNVVYILKNNIKNLEYYNIKNAKKLSLLSFSSSIR